MLTQEAFTDWLFVARACGSGKKNIMKNIKKSTWVITAWFYKQQEKTIP